MKSFAWIAAAFICMMFVNTPAHAQTPANNTVTVAPSVSDVSVDPGKTVSGKLTIANQGLKAFSLELSVSPYSIINEQYGASFEPLPGRTPVTEWIKLNGIESTALNPGKFTDVIFDIAVPQSTKPGGYSAVIFVETEGENNVSNGVKIRNRVAHIVYITVNGAVERDVHIEGPQIGPILFSGEHAIGYRAMNHGGSNEIIEINTMVTDIFGRDIVENTIQRYVLPGTIRSLTQEWQPVQIFGLYKVTATMIGTKNVTNTGWVMVISPLFLMIGSIIIIVVCWLFLLRPRTALKKDRRL